LDKVLTGVRVLDFSRWFAGPYAATLLAAMGAEVIRVERPAGEEERNFGPYAPNGESMLTFVTLQNRKGITLDPLSDKGKEIVAELVRKSDVVLHSYVSGSPDESLLSYDSLRQFNPAIIVAKVSGFGSTGPYATRPCFDTMAQALSGAMSYTGFPGTAPTRSGYAWVDFSTGAHLALGIMFALYHRQRTGKGQFIDIALLDVAVACVAGLAVAAEYKVSGIIRGQQGNASYYNYTNCLRAKDGWLMLGISGNPIWRRFVRAIGRQDLKEDPRLQTDRLRYENRQVIQALLEEWLKDKTAGEAIRIMDEARVPCSPVNNIADMVNDPQVAAREMLVDFECPGIGKIPLNGVVIKMSGTPGAIEMPGPKPGEHNQEVYSTILGFTPEQLAQLKAEGVV
jgi:crotonobetainyl-CoA:carnitine CoA-transferase CaiB-like acyl-CoA transferase